MLTYQSIQQLVEDAQSSEKSLSALILEDQAIQLERSAEALYTDMAYRLGIMKQSISKGISSQTKSPSGLSGGAAFKLRKAIDTGRAIGGNILSETLVKALAMAEVNAGMGIIVAAPTAGSCGILPAVLIALQEENDIPDSSLIMSLFTAAGIGMVISGKAGMSGAEGGCQAECGSASAMAAAAAVELLGGTPQMSAHACALALKSMLGLVCDPVAGLVEVPCVKRNASGAANALVAAELAMAGIESMIPVDEVINAMRRIGVTMQPIYKETAEGGLAATPTGITIAQRFFESP